MLAPPSARDAAHAELIKKLDADARLHVAPLLGLALHLSTRSTAPSAPPRPAPAAAALPPPCPLLRAAPHEAPPRTRGRLYASGVDGRCATGLPFHLDGPFLLDDDARALLVEHAHLRGSGASGGGGAYAPAPPGLCLELGALLGESAGAVRAAAQPFNAALFCDAVETLLPGALLALREVLPRAAPPRPPNGLYGFWPSRKRCVAPFGSLLARGGGGEAGARVHAALARAPLFLAAGAATGGGARGAFLPIEAGYFRLGHLPMRVEAFVQVSAARQVLRSWPARAAAMAVAAHRLRWVRGSFETCFEPRRTNGVRSRHALSPARAPPPTADAGAAVRGAAARRARPQGLWRFDPRADARDAAPRARNPRRARPARRRLRRRPRIALKKSNFNKERSTGWRA